MTKGTFGDNLKREREMRGVSLDEISAATRIATRFLQAIENEQWDQLPGGVFNRGFVRAVAHYLGLDEENIVAEYVLAAGDRQSVPVWSGTPPAVTSEKPWLAWIFAVVILIGLIAGGWFGTRRFLAWRAAKRAAQNAATSATDSPASLEMPANPVSAAAPVTPTPDSVAPTAVPDATSNAADSVPATSSASPAVSPAMTSGTTPAAPAAPVPFELKIAADKKTKVTVHADDDRVFNGTMKAGENHTFTAKDHFEISAHDAGAVQLVLNGKTLAPLGAPGHSGKVTLTREALKGAPGGGN
jgi:cytoskeleton protein RodZ